MRRCRPRWPRSCGVITARGARSSIRVSCLLFGQVVDQLPLDEAGIAEESGQPLATRRVKNRDKHGRQQLPKELERIEVEHDLLPDEKACPACGSERCRIGAEVSEQLEYFPASFKVLKHIRHKYACTRCDADGYTPNVATASEAAAADRAGPARPEPVGLCRDQQAGRSPAAVPAGKYLRPAAGARGPQHDVRLDASGGRTGPAAGRADGGAGQTIASDPHRRHAGADPIARCQAVPQGTHLVLSGRRGESVHRVRLHAQPQARRSAVVAGGF